MELFIRDPDKDWAFIEIANIGRRKIRLQQFGWKVIRGKYVLPGGFYDYAGSKAWVPCDLEEGEARDFPIEEFQLQDAGYAFARTTTGRTYYGGFKSDWRGLFYRVVTVVKSLKEQ